MAAMATAVLPDIVLDHPAALAGIGQRVDEAEIVELLGAVAAAAEDHLLGARGPQPARQEAMRPHAGKQAERRLGKPEIRPALGNDDVEREQRLEPAAQRVALDQTDGDDRQVEPAHVPVQDPHAGAAILHQRLSVAAADMLREQVEVATEREDAGKCRAQHEIFDRQRLRPAGVIDTRLPLREIGEQPGIEARPRRRPHIGPQRVEHRVEADLELVKREQAMVGGGGRDVLRDVGAGEIAGGKDEGHNGFPFYNRSNRLRFEARPGPGYCCLLCGFRRRCFRPQRCARLPRSGWARRCGGPTSVLFQYRR